ncbi:Zinc finger protein 385D [Sciurus carolinensis]|uniref:Zinc finger protein 385D n=1 Tax=Sciurus carolinensis TaxID=30640 RepID=A0AA41ST11_SCICA|nr:Zinc finger protein 385D [Sciurus carolinensis]
MDIILGDVGVGIPELDKEDGAPVSKDSSPVNWLLWPDCDLGSWQQPSKYQAWMWFLPCTLPECSDLDAVLGWLPPEARGACSQDMKTASHMSMGKIILRSPTSYGISNADSTAGTPAISTTTSVEIRKSSVMTTEISSKVEKSPTTATGNSSCPSTETEEEKAKRLLYCSLCKVAVNSASQLEAHNSEIMKLQMKVTVSVSLLKVIGEKQSTWLLADSLQSRNEASADADLQVTTEEGTSFARCLQYVEARGTKHKTMLEARNGSGTIKAFPRAGVKGKGPVNKGNTGLQNKTFHCEICDVHVNSETQLKQHISSRRHKDRAAGKPPKPKYSPYNKLQKAAHPLGVKLVFSKEPSKPLAPRILPNPLAAAAAAAAVAVNSPFSLRTTPAATLFQTSALPPALLRPAPGPIRTAHTPVLFAPY